MAAGLTVEGVSFLSSARGAAGLAGLDAAADPLALWVRASVALREGRDADARADLRAAGAMDRTAPFTAEVSRAMLEQLDRKPAP